MTQLSSRDTTVIYQLYNYNQQTVMTGFNSVRMNIYHFHCANGNKNLDKCTSTMGVRVSKRWSASEVEEVNPT